jgi:hypothetical protein
MRPLLPKDGKRRIVRAFRRWDVERRESGSVSGKKNGFSVYYGLAMRGPRDTPNTHFEGTGKGIEQDGKEQERSTSEETARVL